MLLCTRYGMPGTDAAYAATRHNALSTFMGGRKAPDANEPEELRYCPSICRYGVRGTDAGVPGAYVGTG
eukprot:576986-Rhodomonas_salina.1